MARWPIFILVLNKRCVRLKKPVRAKLGILVWMKKPRLGGWIVGSSTVHTRNIALPCGPSTRGLRLGIIPSANDVTGDTWP